MDSIDSIINSIGELQGRVLILMQEGDRGDSPLASFPNVEWADEVFDAYEHLVKAVKSLRRAGDWE